MTSMQSSNDRHMSHLWGSMPGKLSVLHTSELLLAVMKCEAKVTQGREGLFWYAVQGYTVHGDSKSMACHTESAVRKQVQMNARAQPAFSSTQFRVAAIECCCSHSGVSPPQSKLPPDNLVDTPKSVFPW